MSAWWEVPRSNSLKGQSHQEHMSNERTVNCTFWLTISTIVVGGPSPVRYVCIHSHLSSKALRDFQYHSIYLLGHFRYIATSKNRSDVVQPAKPLQ